MPTTRKKIIKTVYKDENDSEEDKAAGDFSDSGSEAEIPDHTSSDDEDEPAPSSDEEPEQKTKKKQPRFRPMKKTKFAKEFISKLNRQSSASKLSEEEVAPVLFSVKDLTEEDKLLPSVLNLSESDSSDDEEPKVPSKKEVPSSSFQKQNSESEDESQTEYKDVWAQNIQDNSEEVARKTFLELEQHKSKVEEAKASIMNYEAAKIEQNRGSDVKDLLALGEELTTENEELPISKLKKTKKKKKDDSDSEMEDWEEVKEAKTIPQQGIQLVLDFPDASCRKTKKLDVEMMMKRKINRVKKEYQVFMHKVHVLCWLGHGNYVSRVLNDQEVLAAALSMVPSKECYPGERVDMKYLEQITAWYKDKLNLKEDKNEDKFRPKAPPLKAILLEQIKKRSVNGKRNLVFIFVSMLRAIGLQCRVMFNFVTLPIKPPSAELCSLSTKPKQTNKAEENKKEVKNENSKKKQQKTEPKATKSRSKPKIAQVDGAFDDSFSSDSEMENIMQLDGNDDVAAVKSTRSTRSNKKATKLDNNDDNDVSPPKRTRRSPTPKAAKIQNEAVAKEEKVVPEKRKRASRKANTPEINTSNVDKYLADKEPAKPLSRPALRRQRKIEVDEQEPVKPPSVRKTRTNTKKDTTTDTEKSIKTENLKLTNMNPPTIVITNENGETSVASKYFKEEKQKTTKSLSLRKRSHTASGTASTSTNIDDKKEDKPETSKQKLRTKSAPENSVATSKYFTNIDKKSNEVKPAKHRRLSKKIAAQEDEQRVSHRDLIARNKSKSKNDVTGDLVKIIKNRVKEAKEETKKSKVKGIKQESDEDSDYLPEEKPNGKPDSDDDFKPTKISPKPRPSTTKKIDRRVLSSDTEEIPQNKCNVWCEVFVEELEQWISVDVVRAKVHCTNEIYSHATHPVLYVVGWDNNNYLKDVTRRYVPHWNTVTRKQRVEPVWWETAIKPWLGPKTARDREEDEQLDRMQLEAPLPKSVAEYKNHPLYALKRHLLKFEAIYPPDAATLGFVRNEPVYARECVYVCRSRDTWLKEAKVVKLGEQPYKIVKARPKWDKLSNKLITDKPLEIFGPWQVQDYEPPEAKDGIVPRNAYGNVELFKDCMLPKGTVHIKLPGLNRVAKKLNIDCAPAMTGFDFNGGWSHPVYDGFVVCKEFEEIVTEAWLKDQEDQERREREKIEARVYGNWRRLIKGLLIKERLKDKYGFEDPAARTDKKKKGPRLVVKKKN